VANGGPGADVFDADPGDLLDEVEFEHDCAAGVIPAS
jgi:hypothetical protein